MFYCLSYDDLRATICSKMCVISDDFLWMNDYRKAVFQEGHVFCGGCSLFVM